MLPQASAASQVGMRRRRVRLDARPSDRDTVAPLPLDASGRDGSPSRPPTRWGLTSFGILNVSNPVASRFRPPHGGRRVGARLRRALRSSAAQVGTRRRRVRLTFKNKRGAARRPRCLYLLIFLLARAVGAAAARGVAGGAGIAAAVTVVAGHVFGPFYFRCGGGGLKSGATAQPRAKFLGRTY